jgi:hypothetical protein
VDVSQPTAPIEVGHLETAALTSDVEIAGDLLYLADGMGGLRIASLNFPWAPVQVGQVGLIGYSGSLNVSAGFVYVSDEISGMRLVDAQSPTDPVEVGFHFSRTPSYDVVVGKGYAFLAAGGQGIEILNGDLTVSGKVTNHNGTPVTDVAISATLGRGTTVGTDGTYTVTNFLPGTFAITPTTITEAYTFSPQTRTFSLPDDSSGQDFIAVAGLVTTTIHSSTSMTLTYTDTQNLPTHLFFPAGAVSVTTEITVAPILVDNLSRMASAGHAFNLSANQAGSTLNDFSKPVSITISYSELDLQLIHDENGLRFLWWEGARWLEAAETCDQPSGYDRDLLNNQVTVSVCQTGRFALYGPTRSLFMPLVHQG